MTRKEFQKLRGYTEAQLDVLVRAAKIPETEGTPPGTLYGVVPTYNVRYATSKVLTENGLIANLPTYTDKQKLTMAQQAERQISEARDLFNTSLILWRRVFLELRGVENLLTASQHTAVRITDAGRQLVKEYLECSM
jgi:hypothetical protein